MRVPVSISRSSVLLAIALVALVVVAVALVRPGADASHAPGAVSLLYIDTDTTGNTATILGTVEDCASISGIGTLLDVDIAIADWPANGDALAGFELLLTYDPAVVHVSVVDYSLLLGSTFLVGEGPDSDGTLRLSAIDFIGFDEASAGVLARVTLESVGAGQSTLSLSSPSAYILTDPGTGSDVPVSQVDNAFVAVDQGCVPGSQPGPTPPPLPPEACSSPTNADGDFFFSDCIESFVGTDPTNACADTSTPNDEADDKWPPDINDDQFINTFDLVPLVGYFLDPVAAYNPRYDLNTDGVISLLDVLPFRPVFHYNCTELFGPDTDGDGQPDSADACPTTFTSWTTPLGDADCDSFLDAIEAFVGTDSTDSCANTASANDEVDDRWPADTDDNQFINTFDVVPFIPALNSVAPGPPYVARLDLNANSAINVFDVVPFIQLLNEACLP